MQWSPRRLRVVLPALILMLAARGAASAPNPAGDQLRCTGNQNHLWFVMEAGPAGRDKGYALGHHALDLGGPYFKAQASLTQMPMAIASWEDRVWAVFEAKTNAAASQRQVFTIQVQKNPALGGYYSIPSGRLDLVAPLPGAGRLRSFIGTAAGPVALLAPTTPGTAGPLSGAGGESVVQEVDHPRLLGLRNFEWVELELPPGLKNSENMRLAPSGTAGGEFTLLAVSPDDAHRAIKFDRDRAGQWSSSPLPLDLDEVRSLAAVAGQVVAVLADESQPSARIVCLRPGGLLQLATFRRPQRMWAVAGLEDGLRLLERRADGALVLRSIAPLTGAISQSQLMTEQPLALGRLWHLVLLVAIMVFGVMLAFLVRPPASKAQVLLPHGFALLSPGLRIVALLIDMVPAGVVAALILRLPLSDLLIMPVLTATLEQSWAYLLMAGLTFVHSTISELITGKSLGKAVLGARIMRSDGSLPRVGHLLLRNGLKLVILLAPPLAAFAILSPHLQGLDDMAAGTVVVHEVDKTHEADEQDR